MRILITKLDDWENPSFNLPVIEQVLVNDDRRILFVPSGYVTAVQQAEDGKVIVFSSISAKELEANGKILPSPGGIVRLLCDSEET